jgi:hypothetical protein
MEHIWDTFDALWRKVNAQEKRVVELETKVRLLEAKLARRSAPHLLMLGEVEPESVAGYPFK